MKIRNAIDVVGGVDGERNAVEAFATNETGETGRMERTTRRSKDSLQDGLATGCALFKSVLRRGGG